MNKTIISLNLDLLPKGFTDSELNSIYYDLSATSSDQDDLLEAPSFAVLDAAINTGTEMILDSVEAKYRTLPRVLRFFNHKLSKQLVTQSKGPLNSNGPVEIGDPKKSAGTAIVTARFPVSDGQYITAMFHAPDMDPQKINPDDTLIAFRWLLNGRDITHVVTPASKGGTIQDISLDTVTKRLAQLAEKNTIKFTANRKRAEEQKAKLEELAAKSEQNAGIVSDLNEEVISLNETIDSTNRKVTKKSKALEDLTSENDALQSEIDNWKEKVAAKAKAATSNRPPMPSSSNGAISSDDANAADLVRVKLEERIERQKNMKAANKIIKSKKDVNSRLASELGLSGSEIEDLVNPRHTATPGYQSFTLSNNNAEIRRLRKRMEALEKLSAEEDREFDFDGGTVEVDTGDNRIKIYYTVKPDADARKELKRNGFKWSPTNGAWQRQITPAAKYSTNLITGVDVDDESQGAGAGPGVDVDSAADAESQNTNQVDPIAAVDEKHKFNGATDDFKSWVFESIDKPDYSPFLSAVTLDEAAKKNGLEISGWDYPGVTDGNIATIKNNGSSVGYIDIGDDGKSMVFNTDGSRAMSDIYYTEDLGDLAVFVEALAKTANQPAVDPTQGVEQPPLIGSEKQIAWAEKIRAKITPILRQAALVKLEPPKQKEAPTGRRRRVRGAQAAWDDKSIVEALEAIKMAINADQAGFWIDSRDAHKKIADLDYKGVTKEIGLALEGYYENDALSWNKKARRAGAEMLKQGEALSDQSEYADDLPPSKRKQIVLEHLKKLSEITNKTEPMDALSKINNLLGSFGNDDNLSGREVVGLLSSNYKSKEPSTQHPKKMVQLALIDIKDQMEKALDKMDGGSPDNQAEKSGDSDIQQKIAALKDMPAEQYEQEMTALISELEANGRLAEFEGELVKIDKSRDADLIALANKTLEG